MLLEREDLLSTGVDALLLSVDGSDLAGFVEVAEATAPKPLTGFLSPVSGFLFSILFAGHGQPAGGYLQGAVAAEADVAGRDAGGLLT